LAKSVVRAGMIEPKEGGLRRRNFATVPVVDAARSGRIDVALRLIFECKAKDLPLLTELDAVLDVSVAGRRLPIASSASTGGVTVSLDLGIMEPT